MILNIATDWPLTDDYLEVFKTMLEERSWDGDIYTVESLADATDGPLIVLGSPEGFRHIELTHAPSVRETLGTAGGLTKLGHAMNLVIDPSICSELEWWFADNYPGSLKDWTGQCVSADIEVSGDITVDEPEDTDLLCLSLARRVGDKIHAIVYSQDMLEQPKHRRAVVKLLRRNTIVAHNGQFDFRWLNRQLADVLTNPLYPDEDTILLHHALYPGAGEHGLKPVCARIFGAPDWDHDIKTYTGGRKGHFERIPADKLADYNAKDVYWTLLLFERLAALAKDTPQERLYYEHALPASHMFQDMEEHGMWVDENYLAMLDVEVGGQVEHELHNLRQFTENSTFNPGSVPQLKKELAKLGAHVSSTAEERLLTLIQDPDNTNPSLTTFIHMLLEYRGVKKTHSTYITSVIKKVRREKVHANFLVFGTSTGRLSCKSPNLQNLTNEEEGRLSIRRMYGAPPGYKIVGADYAQAELRTMAEISGDELMISHLQRDSTDFFDNMLPTIFPGVDFTGLDKAHRKPYRLRIKRVVYGTSYGLGIVAISQMLTLGGAPTTIGEAAAMQEGYLGLYPGLQAWRDSVFPRVLDGDDLLTPFGRRFQQDVITDKNARRVQNQAWAFQPQSIASDICVTAAMEIHKIFNAHPARDVHICASVHDAIYATAPNKWAQWTKKVIPQQMEASAAKIFSRVPFMADAAVGQFWDEV